MTLSVLMVVEGTSPEISRCLNVDEATTLGELAQMIDAALGFSGAATHLFVGKHGTTREVYAEVPGPSELDEEDLTVAQMEPMTYVYDPSANWNVHVEVLGKSHIDGPTPMVVDACGPDIVEECSGPELMTKFRQQARLLAAGVEPDVDTITLMFSYLPVMPPERLLDRLSVVDPVSVATRVGFVAEELFFDKAAAAGEQPGGKGLAQSFDDFISARPDLQEVIDIDPHPERNPAIISAVTEFFDGILGGTDFAEPVGFDDSVQPSDIMAELLEIFEEPVPHQGGRVTDTAVVGQILIVLGGGDARAAVAFLQAGGFVKKVRGTYRLGDNADVSVPALTEGMRLGMEKIVGKVAWRQAVEWLVGDRKKLPTNPDKAFMWARLFALVEEREPGHLYVSDQGREIMLGMLAFYNQPQG